MQTAHGRIAVVPPIRLATAWGLILLALSWAAVTVTADEPATATESAASEPPQSPEQGPSPQQAPSPEQTQAPEPSGSQASLGQQIDQLLQPAAAPFAPAITPDGLLLRRLSLDLRGVVPTREELDAFLADTAEDRWSTWVDRFLQDPLCDEHLVNFLDRTLMLRRSHTLVDRAAWLIFLRDRVASDTPIDQLSAELLYTPWWNQEHRAAQRFYLDRGGDPHLITRDLARVFLGRDLQCAQCHDHPLVDDFRQVDYHGLLAFVSAGSLVEVAYKDAEQKDQKVQLYVEKAAADAPFESVFERGTMLRSGTRLAGKSEHFDDYELPDQRYRSQLPDGAMAGVPLPPSVSRREQLSQQLASRENGEFVANWANRLWALIYGRGLVHPVDMMEPDNPPSHPELFQLITSGLLQSEMRIKPFLRQLVMTEAYQRGSATLGEPLVSQLEADATVQLLQQLESDLQSSASDVERFEAAENAALSAYESARDAWLKIQADRTAVRAELDTAEAAMLDAKKKHEEANAAVAAAQKKLADNQSRASLLDESAAKLQQALSLAGAEDAELSQAIALAKQRAEAARGEVAGLEKGVADAQSAVTAAEPPLQQATEKVNEVVQRLRPIQEALRAADEQHIASRKDWFTARSTVVAARKSLARTERLVQWVTDIDKSRQLAQQMPMTEAKLVSAKAAEADGATAVDAAKKSLAMADQELQAANQLAVQAKEAMSQHQQVVQTLQQSLVSLADATKLVSSTEALLAAQSVLQQEVTAKQTQLGEFQSAVDAAEAQVRAKTESRNQQAGEVEAKIADHQQRLQRSNEVQQQWNDLQSQLETIRSEIAAKGESIGDDLETQLAATRLAPLTAEQLCWSTLRVTGVLDAYIRTELTELEKQSPLPAEADEATKAQRQRQAVRQAIEKLRGIADHYVSLYASGPDKTQDDFFASADQALYIANGGSVFGWAGPGNNNPTQAATSLTEPSEIAQVLYWSYLCRQPTSDEVALVTEQLASAGDQRNAVIHEMAWSLLASAEFRFAR